MIWGNLKEESLEGYSQRQAPYDWHSVCFPTSIANAILLFRMAGFHIPEEFSNGIDISYAILADLEENDDVYRQEWRDVGKLKCRYSGDFWSWYFTKYYAEYFECRLENLPAEADERCAEIDRLLSSFWLPVVGTVFDSGREEASGHRRTLIGVDRESQTVALLDPWGIDESTETPDGQKPYTNKSTRVYWKHVNDEVYDLGKAVNWMWSGAYFALRPTGLK